MKYITNDNIIEIREKQKALGTGSEGKVFLIDGLVYKIYYPVQIFETGETKQKWHQYMLGIPTQQIYLPTSLIFTYYSGYYAGYVTNFANGNQSKKQGFSKMNGEKLFTNLNVLYQDTDLLSKHFIKTQDLSIQNYIYDEENQKMNLIDPGRYHSINFEKYKNYFNENRQNLEKLIWELIALDLTKLKIAKTQKEKNHIIAKIEEQKKENAFIEFIENYITPSQTLESYLRTLKK